MLVSAMALDYQAGSREAELLEGYKIVSIKRWEIPELMKKLTENAIHV